MGCARDGTNVIVCVLMLSRLAVLVAMFVVKFFLRMGVLEEQDGVVLGVSRLLPSGLVSSHWSISNEHFQLQLPHSCSRHD